MLRIVLLCLLQLCDAKKLLVVFPVPSWSHAVFGDSLVKVFIDAGHEVTYVTSVTSLQPDARLKFLNISSTLYSVTDRERIRLMELVRNPRPSRNVLEIGALFARRALENEVTQKLLQDPESAFDVVIAEWYYSGLLAPLASVYRCPLVWYSTVDVNWMNLQLMDGHTNPAYSVDPQARSSTSGYGVWDRVARLWTHIQMTAWLYYTFYYVEAPIYYDAYRSVLELRGQTMLDYESVVYNASLMLVNSHPLVGQSLPVPQNVKYVGGYHIQGNNKAIPKKLMNILEQSQNGVIFFNLGPNVRGKDMSERSKRRLLDMFGQLEQTVIWKFEESLQGHSNIHILKGVSQISLLNHTNTMIFITHGDLKSCMEAANFGVPVIAIPLFGDQFYTSSLVNAKGRGLKVDFNEDMPDRINDAIYEILGNYSYRSKALEASAVFQNHLLPPREELLYWTELVMEHETLHLRSPALQLSLFQKLYLDVVALLLMVLWFLSKVVKVIRVHSRSDDEEYQDSVKKDK